MRIFFVSKFDWLSSGPMSTVSTIFTHAISCQKINITFVTQCSEQCDTNHVLKNRFGLLPTPFFSMCIFRKKPLLRSSTLFYLKAAIYLLFKAEPTDIIYTRNSTFLPYLYISLSCLPEPEHFLKLTVIMEIQIQLNVQSASRDTISQKNCF